VRIFKTKWFERYARKSGISDVALRAAVERVENGLVDADLGGGLLKQRVARPGGGKSGGFRTVLVYRQDDRAVFVFGFAKSERDNLSKEEEREYKKFANMLLSRTIQQLEALVAQGAYEEIT
jgi:hypothetical protein